MCAEKYLTTKGKLRPRRNCVVELIVIEVKFHVHEFVVCLVENHTKQ